MDWEPTIAALQEALKHSPENLPLRLYLAKVLEQSGNLQAAVKEYQAILEQDAGHEQARLGLTRVLYQMGRFNEALQNSQDLLLLHPKLGDGYLLLAKIYHALNQTQKAQAAYARALSLQAEPDPQLAKELYTQRTPAQPSSRDLPDERESREYIEVERPEITFASVGGMKELKEQIHLTIIYPFLHPEIYEAYGKKVGGGILLYGPPGCGKTLIAKATASECYAAFISIGIEDVFRPWMGESEQLLHTIFERARDEAPAVLFFDELDALATKRSNTAHWYRTVVNQFLAEMDGIKSHNEDLIIMGATNSPWHIDSAFLRPGRFDRIIFVPPPDLQARIEIFRIHLHNKPIENVDFVRLAKQTKHFSGADIAEVCERAAEAAIQESLRTGKIRNLTTDDFLRPLKKMRPTTEEWFRTAKNYATYANQSGLYDQVLEYLEKEME